jgi:hypothetical protein
MHMQLVSSWMCIFNYSRMKYYKLIPQVSRTLDCIGSSQKNWIVVLNAYSTRTELNVQWRLNCRWRKKFFVKIHSISLWIIQKKDHDSQREKNTKCKFSSDQAECAMMTALLKNLVIVRHNSSYRIERSRPPPYDANEKPIVHIQLVPSWMCNKKSSI